MVLPRQGRSERSSSMGVSDVKEVSEAKECVSKGKDQASGAHSRLLDLRRQVAEKLGTVLGGQLPNSRNWSPQVPASGNCRLTRDRHAGAGCARWRRLRRRESVRILSLGKHVLSLRERLFRERDSLRKLQIQRLRLLSKL